VVSNSGILGRHVQHVRFWVMMEASMNQGDGATRTAAPRPRSPVPLDYTGADDVDNRRRDVPDMTESVLERQAAEPLAGSA